MKITTLVSENAEMKEQVHSLTSATGDGQHRPEQVVTFKRNGRSRQPGIRNILGRELITAHASSLLDKYVGDTEEKLAALFAQAREKGAVLLLDEVDTLLTQRDNSMQNWVISHTNELLVKIENFDGILLATTSRADSLDRTSCVALISRWSFCH